MSDITCGGCESTDRYRDAYSGAAYGCQHVHTINTGCNGIWNEISAFTDRRLWLLSSTAALNWQVIASQLTMTNPQMPANAPFLRRNINPPCQAITLEPWVVLIPTCRSLM